MYLRLVWFAAGVVIIAACYSNSIDGEFVWDDIPAILENADVRGVTPLSEAFWNDFWGHKLQSSISHKWIPTPIMAPLQRQSARADEYLRRPDRRSALVTRGELNSVMNTMGLALPSLPMLARLTLPSLSMLAKLLPRGLARWTSSRHSRASSALGPLAGTLHAPEHSPVHVKHANAKCHHIIKSTF
eukprot:4160661-Pyramimonas_sp.AAC.1